MYIYIDIILLILRQSSSKIDIPPLPCTIVLDFHLICNCDKSFLLANVYPMQCMSSCPSTYADKHNHPHICYWNIYSWKNKIWRKINNTLLKPKKTESNKHVVHITVPYHKLNYTEYTRSISQTERAIYKKMTIDLTVPYFSVEVISMWRRCNSSQYFSE